MTTLPHDRQAEDTSVEWQTPAWLCEAVRSVAPIGLDPCGHPASVVGARRQYLLANGEDGLALPWRVNAGECVFVNPPWGKGIDQWVRRAVAVANEGPTVVFLGPSRLDSKWAQGLLRACTTVAILSPRVAYTDPLGKNRTAPNVGSALWLLAPHGDATLYGRFERTFQSHGVVLVPR